MGRGGRDAVGRRRTEGGAAAGGWGEEAVVGRFGGEVAAGVGCDTEEVANEWGGGGWREEMTSRFGGEVGRRRGGRTRWGDDGGGGLG